MDRGKSWYCKDKARTPNKRTRPSLFSWPRVTFSPQHQYLEETGDKHRKWYASSHLRKGRSRHCTLNPWILVQETGEATFRETGSAALWRCWPRHCACYDSLTTHPLGFVLEPANDLIELALNYGAGLGQRLCHLPRDCSLNPHESLK